MSNPFEFVPADLIPKLSALKIYTLVVLTKGENYFKEDTMKIIQSEHLPYTFKLREEGMLALSMPIRDETNLAAIGIYTITDKQQVENLLKNDPAIIKKVFNYEIVTAMGMKGDVLT